MRRRLRPQQSRLCAIWSDWFSMECAIFSLRMNDPASSCNGPAAPLLRASLPRFPGLSSAAAVPPPLSMLVWFEPDRIEGMRGNATRNQHFCREWSRSSMRSIPTAQAGNSGSIRSAWSIGRRAAPEFVANALAAWKRRPQATINVTMTRNNRDMLARYNRRVIEQCHERVYCSAKTGLVLA
jgi:hypothetical protein